jgi:diguanylate cyclase (GGDEF)-like protein
VRNESEGILPAQRRPRWLTRLSIRALLVVVMLVPLAVAVTLASTVMVHQLGSRNVAIATRQSSLDLDALLQARVSVYAEYVPSQSIATSRAYGVTTATLDGLLGVNVQSELIAFRRLVDRQAAFAPNGAFRTQYLQLVKLRRSLDAGTATPVEVTALFNRFDSAIENRWLDTFNHVLDTSEPTDAPTIRHRLHALGSSFAAFTSGVTEESLRGGGSLETLLTTSSTPAQLEGLIVSEQQFADSTSTFPGALGPEATTAWRALTGDAPTRQFAEYVRTAITVGLGHLPPPVAVTSTGISAIARSEVAWAGSLSTLVLASSADLRASTTAQANSATRNLILTSVLTVIFLAIVMEALFLLGRAISRPLDRMVAAASSVGEGELDFPPLDESGPKELATAASAFNEMAATLRAVQAQAIALSGGDPNDPVLRMQLPGRTGAALQIALDQLQQSVQSGEREREALFERATRDSLTGLLNRGAALEALELDLASVRRTQGEQVLTLFFIDLDDLKSINDTIGHDGGDAAIVAVADALRATTRASDVAARFGGDEFLVGWMGSRGSLVPARLAERIGDHVAAAHIGSAAHPVALACSIGMAVSEPSDTAIGMLIERADEALYDAKARGKGQTRWFGQIDLDAAGTLVTGPHAR